MIGSRLFKTTVLIKVYSKAFLQNTCKNCGLINSCLETFTKYRDNVNAMK
jgi:hypothetical protein